MTPRTIASSVVFEGSCSSVNTGFSLSPKNACPEASPNPFGMMTATAVSPFLTVARAPSSVGFATFRFLSASAPATIAFEIALPSRSTIAIAIRAGSRSCPPPENTAPKNDAIAIGTTKLTITDRRSLKNNCRSLRTIARSGMTAISRASSFRSA